jgi:hypothetical protein
MQRAKRVPGLDFGRQQAHQQMDEQRDENEIIDDPDERQREIDRIEGVQPKYYGDGPQPEWPPRMPQREPEQPKITRHQPPEPEQSEHGVLPHAESNDVAVALAESSAPARRYPFRGGRVGQPRFASRKNSMALFKHEQYLDDSDQGAFDQLHRAGHVAPESK